MAKARRKRAGKLRSGTAGNDLALQRLQREITRKYRPRGAKWSFFGKGSLQNKTPLRETGRPEKKAAKTKGTRQRQELVEIVMKLRGTTPNLKTMGQQFDLAAKKGGTRKLRLQRVANRALWSMVDTHGLFNGKTNNGIREIIRELNSKGKISLSGKTCVKWGRAEAKLGLLIGKRGARQFMRYFEQYLRDETNYYRSHRGMLNGKVLREKQWAKERNKKNRR